MIVATPPSLHFAMAKAALEAGKPVLVEKPFTCDIAEAEALAALSRRLSVPLLVEHTQLHAPAFRALAALIPGMGGLRAIHARANAEGPFRPDVPVLWDWGAHDVAMCLSLAGVPSRADARRLQRRPGTRPCRDHRPRSGLAGRGNGGHRGEQHHGARAGACSR